MIGIVVSRADEASEHVGEQLLDLVDWERRVDDSRSDADGSEDDSRPDAGGDVYVHGDFELREFDDLHLELDDVAEAFSERPDLVAFASRHSGDTGALLTAHFTGNFGRAEYGGRDDALATAAPGAQSALLASFEAYAPDGYDVGMECTHHGPSDVGCPSLFVELGSDDAQWRDSEGARAVAAAILDLDGVDPRGERTVVGFGGGHYVPRFERIVRETAWTVGHVAADWGLEAMGSLASNRDVIDGAFAASDAEHALVEGTRPDLEAVIEELGYRVVGETWVRAVDDRDLDAVAALESALGAVADGLRFGDRRPWTDTGAEPGAGGSWTVRALPDDLVDAARTVDEDVTRALIERETVAFQTRNGGSQAEGRAAFPDDSATSDSKPEAYDALVDALASVLEDAYDEVRREDARVVAAKDAFDPGLARTTGVPEGPKFGKLAAGEPVTVDGDVVHPERVSVRQEDVYEI